MERVIQSVALAVQPKKSESDLFAFSDVYYLKLLLPEPSLPPPSSSGKKPQVTLFGTAKLNSNCVGHLSAPFIYVHMRPWPIF